LPIFINQPTKQQNQHSNRLQQHNQQNNSNRINTATTTESTEVYSSINIINTTQQQNQHNHVQDNSNPKLQTIIRTVILIKNNHNPKLLNPFYSNKGKKNHFNHPNSSKF